MAVKIIIFDQFRYKYAINRNVFVILIFFLTECAKNNIFESLIGTTIVKEVAYQISLTWKVQKKNCSFVKIVFSLKKNFELGSELLHSTYCHQLLCLRKLPFGLHCSCWDICFDFLQTPNRHISITQIV
jgi:hypothetical protein